MNRAALILQHTVPTRRHLTPELVLRLITPACPLWTATEDQLPFPDPFWGFYWPGGQATARYLGSSGPTRRHLTPELVLRLITPACPLWTATEDQLPFPDPFWGFYWPGGQATARYHGSSGANPKTPHSRAGPATHHARLPALDRHGRQLPFPDPFWGFYWPGDQATARYILDNPEIVRNRRVLDIGCGCGAGAIAAAKMNASSVLANDIDPFSLEATKINAALNNVTVGTNDADLIGTHVESDTLLIGDMFYDAMFAERLFEWLMGVKGSTILIGDPGRLGLAARRPLLTPLATYRLPPDSCLENRGFPDTTLWQLKNK